MTMRINVACIIDKPGLGQSIKAARKAAKKSQSQIAGLAGISRQYLSEIENETGTGGVSVGVVRKLEDAIGCKLLQDFQVNIDYQGEVEYGDGDGNS